MREATWVERDDEVLDLTNDKDVKEADEATVGAYDALTDALAAYNRLASRTDGRHAVLMLVRR